MYIYFIPYYVSVIHLLIELNHRILRPVFISSLSTVSVLSYTGHIISSGLSWSSYTYQYVVYSCMVTAWRTSVPRYSSIPWLFKDSGSDTIGRIPVWSTQWTQTPQRPLLCGWHDGQISRSCMLILVMYYECYLLIRWPNTCRIKNDKISHKEDEHCFFAWHFVRVRPGRSP